MQIWDRFSAACTLTRQHSILEGLVEITECHGDVSESFPAWLMPEYQDILSNRIQIRLAALGYQHPCVDYYASFVV